jgi:hypothetical protein
VGRDALRSAVRRRRACQAAALVGIGVAIPAAVVRASPGEDARTAPPARIVVVAGGCESKPVDATALAAALRVEMVQEGVSNVDVAAPGSSALEDPSVATVRLLPASCDAPVGLPGFEIVDGATGRSVRSTLSIADIDRSVRARVAALVIAERVRASWKDLASIPTAHETAAGDGGTPAGSSGSPAAGAPVMLGGPAAPPGAPPPLASSAPEHIETSPEPDLHRTHLPSRAGRQTQTATPQRFALGAAVEGRSFFGPGTGLLGPRAVAVLPGFLFSSFRIHFDAGVGWGMARDALGDVSVTLVSGGLGFAVMAGRGALQFELGPKAEIGWTWVHGVPRTPGARGSAAGAALGTASVLACLFAEIAPHWTALAAIDVGVAFAGVEARANTRPIADTAGLMLGARAGFAYAF